MIKRFTSTVLILICVLILFSTTLLAYDFKPLTLTVKMEYGNILLNNITVSVCRIADIRERNIGVYGYVLTQEFSGSGVDLSDMSAARNIILSSVLDSYATSNSISRDIKVTDSYGGAVYTNILPGLYLVAQIDDGMSEYIFDPFLISVFEDSEPFTNSITAYPKAEPKRRDDENTSVSVYKLWVGNNEHPMNIQVQLYGNNIPEGAPVTLNENTNWEHTWSELSNKIIWTVDEINLPAGYTKKITGNSTGFIITNTYIPKTSDNPEKSNTPTDIIPKTGMLRWPIPIFGSIGLLFIIFGVAMTIKGRKVNEV